MSRQLEDAAIWDAQDGALAPVADDLASLSTADIAARTRALENEIKVRVGGQAGGDGAGEMGCGEEEEEEREGGEGWREAGGARCARRPSGAGGGGGGGKIGCARARAFFPRLRTRN